MRLTHTARTFGALVLAAGAGLTLAACTYVEREPARPASTTIIQPPPQAQPTVVAPVAPPPTVTVRPSY